MTVTFTGMTVRDMHIYWKLLYNGSPMENDTPACQYEEMFRSQLLNNIAHLALPWPMPTCLWCAAILFRR